MSTLRVSDLPDLPDPGVMLYCRTCGAEYSATRGDYWSVDPRMRPAYAPDFTVRCGCPGRPLLKLVRKVTSYHEEDSES